MSTLIVVVLATCCTLTAATSTANEVKAKSTPWIRVQSTPANPSMDPKERFYAYTGANDMGLKVLTLNNKLIISLSTKKVGPSKFWSPDGNRLFFTELSQPSKGQFLTELKAWDSHTNKIVAVDSYPHKTGYMVFDPRDQKIHMMHPKGIHSKSIAIPGLRLSKWQRLIDKPDSRWIATPQGVVWLYRNGLAMRKISEASSRIASFDISPDGTGIAWATDSGRIFVSFLGESARFLAMGHDPKWHSQKKTLLIAGSRMLGNKAVGTDLQLISMEGQKRWLTHTQHSNERWPHWSAGGNDILYTKKQTTDLFKLRFVR